MTPVTIPSKVLCRSTIMSLSHRLTTGAACLAFLCLTGCVGPMACGPSGSCGPIGLNNQCDGCGECEGCGELYIDPWINHPADCCDPCDKCGNYNGQSCGKCRSVFDGFATLWGYRCDPPCDGCGSASCAGGCDAISSIACGGSSCGGCDTCGGGGEVLHITNAQPTPAKQIVEATPMHEEYHPQRTRKIFRARPDVASGPPQASDY